MGLLVIVAYRPRSGQEEALLRAVRDHDRGVGQSADDHENLCGRVSVVTIHPHKPAQRAVVPDKRIRYGTNDGGSSRAQIAVEHVLEKDYLPSRAGAIAFSPDGRELALLWDVERL